MIEAYSPIFYKKLQRLKIHTKRSFLGSRQGVHRSLRKGHGLEFSDFRAYAQGDDYRYIDWGIYGRTDRFYVRQFREEQDLNVLVLLDCSKSMNYPIGENKFELARSLALALSYIALTDGDPVSISLLGQKSLPKFLGSKSLNRLRQELNILSPIGELNIVNAVKEAIHNRRIPGKCFLISDFMCELDEQYKALDYIRSRNFEICLLRILTPSELTLNPKTLQKVIDSETQAELDLALDSSSAKEYALALARHLNSLEKYCYKTGISYLLLSSQEDLADIVLSKLPRAGILK